MLVKTAAMSRASLADVVGISDPDVAFAFNLECADIVNEWEQEREFEKEKRQLELLTGQVMTSALGSGPTKDSSNAERW